jgi:hypothetical protein
MHVKISGDNQPYLVIADGSYPFLETVKTCMAVKTVGNAITAKSFCHSGAVVQRPESEWPGRLYTTLATKGKKVCNI